MRLGTRVAALLLAAMGWGCTSGVEVLASTGELEAEPASLQEMGPATSKTVTPVDIPLNQVGGYRCTRQPLRAAEVRRLVNRPLFQSVADVFPGALLQGKPYLSGAISPLTIPRGSGRLHVQGAALPQENTTRELDMVTSGGVLSAIQDVLAAHGPFSVATPSLLVGQTFSDAHLHFALGVDGRFRNAQVADPLELDTPRERNAVFVRLSQTFFTVTMDPPDTAVGAFRDREHFDAQGQMGEDNPPLLVTEVAYGRQLLLVADAEYNAVHLEAALRGAFEGKPASTEAMPGLTYGQVLARTHLRYALRGPQGVEGTPGYLGLQAIDASEPAARYDVLKDLLVDKTAASFDREHMGVPIAYTLHYLKTGEVARASFVATYEQRDCALTPTSMPAGPHRFRVHLGNLEDRVRVVRPDRDVPLFETDAADFEDWVDLTPQLDDGDTEVRVELFNTDATAASLSLQLQHLSPAGEATTVLQRLFFKKDAPVSGPTLEAAFRLNRTSGGPDTQVLSITEH